MEYTKEQFQKLWDANDTGSGLTNKDLADCAKAWGLYSTPYTHPIEEVREAVLKASQCQT